MKNKCIYCCTYTAEICPKCAGKGHEDARADELKKIGKVIGELIEDKRKIAEKNLTSVQDSDGKATTLYVYLGLLNDSIKQKLGLK